MVQVPRFTSVDLQTPRAVPLQAPQVQPLGDVAGPEIKAIGEAMGALGEAGVRTAYYQGKQEQIEAQRALEDAYRDDVAAVKEADATFGDVVREELFNHRQLVGGEAYEQQDPTMQRIEEKRRKLYEGLRNDRQREAFSQSANSRVSGARMDVVEWGSRQRDVRDATVSQARQEGFIKDTATPNKVVLVQNADGTYPVATEGFRVAYESALRENDTWERMNAMGTPEERKQQRALKDLEVSTRIHEQVLSNLMVPQTDESTAAAMKWFEEHKDEIDPRKHDSYMKIGRAAADSVTVRKYTDDMKFVVMPIEEQKQRIADDDTLTANQKWLATNRVEARSKEARERAMSYAVGSMNEGMQWIEANPNKPLTDMPPILTATLEQTGMSTLLQQYKDNNNTWKTDERVFSSVTEMPAEKLGAMTPSEIVLRYRGSLSDKDLNVVLALNANIRGDATKEQKSIISLSDRMSAYIEEARIPKNERTQFRRAVEQEYDMYRRDVLGSKRDLDAKEMQQVIETVALREVETQSWTGFRWASGKQKVYTMDAAEFSDPNVGAYVKDASGVESFVPLSTIPEDRLALIRQDIMRHNTIVRLTGQGTPLEDSPKGWLEEYMRITGQMQTKPTPMPATPPRDLRTEFERGAGGWSTMRPGGF